MLLKNKGERKEKEPGKYFKSMTQVCRLWEEMGEGRNIWNEESLNVMYPWGSCRQPNGEFSLRKGWPVLSFPATLSYQIALGPDLSWRPSTDCTPCIWFSLIGFWAMYFLGCHRDQRNYPSYFFIIFVVLKPVIKRKSTSLVLFVCPPCLPWSHNWLVLGDGRLK